MNSNTNNPTPIAPKENVLAGIVGAFLFSLVGGILWFLLDRIDFVAGISGIVGVIAANRGYSFFAKATSKKGIVLSTVIALLILVLAWYLCFSLDLAQAYEMWYENGEVDYLPTYFECVANGYLYLTDPEIAFGYISTLLIGLALACLATIPTVKQLLAQEKLAKEAPLNAEFTEAEAQPTVTQTEDDNTTSSAE